MKRRTAIQCIEHALDNTLCCVSHFFIFSFRIRIEYKGEQNYIKNSFQTDAQNTRVLEFNR